MPLEKLLKNRDHKKKEPTAEEVEEEMKKDLKDKLIPYHNMAYQDQIKNKEDYLKQVFKDFVKRITQESISDQKSLFKNSENDSQIPGWLSKYWSTLQPERLVENQEEEEKHDDLSTPNTLSSDRLPCEFEGIIQGDKDQMQGYRNKVEFTIGRHYYDKQMGIGFMKSNTNKGILFTDYPYEIDISKDRDIEISSLKPLPHISLKSVQCAYLVQELLRDLETKIGLKEYNSLSHEGGWRSLLFKESKRTNQGLVSVSITKDSMTQEQLDLFSKLLLELCNDKLDNVVSVSVIESVGLNGGFEFDDEIKYLTDNKTYTEELNGYKFLVSPQAFFQVNSHVFDKILYQIREWAELDENTILLDIGGGTGVIGIALSAYVKKVIGIEMVESAITDGKANGELNNITHGKDGKCEYYCGKAEDVLPKLSKVLQRNKIIAVVDPPRSGLHPTVLKALRTGIGLDRIVYVSCNANSLSENLYHLSMTESKKRKAPELRPVKFCGADLFPYSPHVEGIMLLERYYEG